MLYLISIDQETLNAIISGLERLPKEQAWHACDVLLPQISGLKQILRELAEQEERAEQAERAADTTDGAPRH